MSNPITSWVKSGMETYKEREDKMVERVSETSINSQKFSDERHGPFKTYNCFQGELRTKPNYRQTHAISSYAGKDIGVAGSYIAVRAYQDEFAKRRDEILTDIANNG
ncbi:hypothetical protein ACHAXT_000519 [Thalassiosira profunda]